MGTVGMCERRRALGFEQRFVAQLATIGPMRTTTAGSGYAGPGPTAPGRAHEAVMARHKMLKENMERTLLSYDDRVLKQAALKVPYEAPPEPEPEPEPKAQQETGQYSPMSLLTEEATLYSARRDDECNASDSRCGVALRNWNSHFNECFPRRPDHTMDSPTLGMGLPMGTTTRLGHMLFV